MIKYVVETYHRLIEELDVKTQRYLYPQFQLHDRLIGLIGPRGVGKTTLLLQYIKNNLYADGKAFYFSADLVYFDQMNLLEFVTDLYENGGYRYIFIDEIHKYANWNQELKNIYDSFPNLTVVFSGSSMLDVVHGAYDLSRRAVLFHMNGLSFREYLHIQGLTDLDALCWEDILKGPNLPIQGLQSHFNHYLKMGYYPFLGENPLSYMEKVKRMIEKTIFEDISNYFHLKTTSLQIFKKILTYVASIPPGEINASNLGKHIGADHKTVSHYLDILNRVGLIRLVYPLEKGSSGVRKPCKIFIHNTSLLHAVNELSGNEVSKGMERELFFFQSVIDAGISVNFSKIGDFIAKDCIFEIGGRSKTGRQLQKASLPAYLVKDDIRYKHGIEIPLYFFGFLY